MRAVPKDLFGGEVALLVNRHLAARHPDRMVRGYASALHFHGAASERNLVARQVAFAIGGHPLARCWRVGRDRFSSLIGRRLTVQPQWMLSRFVEISFRVISAQQVLELASRGTGESLDGRLPFREAGGVDRDDFERRGL